MGHSGRVLVPSRNPKALFLPFTDARWELGVREWTPSSLDL